MAYDLLRATMSFLLSRSLFRSHVARCKNLRAISFHVPPTVFRVTFREKKKKKTSCNLAVISSLPIYSRFSSKCFLLVSAIRLESATFLFASTSSCRASRPPRPSSSSFLAHTRNCSRSRSRSRSHLPVKSLLGESRTCRVHICIRAI